MIKKPSIKKVDRLLQEWFVPRNPKCIVCGGVTSEGHHVINKSKSNNLRYDVNNLVPLCRGCHCRHHLSGDPYIISTIIQKKGQEWFDDLQVRRRIICKLNKDYLLDVVKRLTQNENGIH